MKAHELFLVIVALLTLVAGQILLKWALGDDDDKPDAAMTFRRKAWIFAGGIGCMTISFFVNLGLLQHLELSLIFPFQGMSVLIVTLGACYFLKERLTAPLIIGTLLITAGVMLVSAS